MSSEKPITIITTIYPFKGGKTAITVAVAPEGESPVFTTGTFTDWHRLESEAYVQSLKRLAKSTARKNGQADSKTSPKKTVRRKDKRKDSLHADTVAMTKRIASASKVGRGETPRYEPAETEPDQIGPAAGIEQGPGSPLVNDKPDLPVIEGDDDGQLELDLEGSDG